MLFIQVIVQVGEQIYEVQGLVGLVILFVQEYLVSVVLIKGVEVMVDQLVVIVEKEQIKIVKVQVKFDVVLNFSVDKFEVCVGDVVKFIVCVIIEFECQVLFVIVQVKLLVGFIVVGEIIVIVRVDVNNFGVLVFEVKVGVVVVGEQQVIVILLFWNKIQDFGVWVQFIVIQIELCCSDFVIVQFGDMVMVMLMLKNISGVFVFYQFIDCFGECFEVLDFVIFSGEFVFGEEKILSYCVCVKGEVVGQSDL